VPNSIGQRPSTTAPGASPTTGTGRSSEGVQRNRYTVAVLNGTTITNLARGASDKLQRAGYVGGRVTNDTTNQARDTTVVYYKAGSRPAALDVAKLIKVRSSAVQPLGNDATEQGLVLLAGQDADVIVSVGQDLAQ
jgi:hypothetical protein